VGAARQRRSKNFETETPRTASIEVALKGMVTRTFSLMIALALLLPMLAQVMVAQGNPTDDKIYDTVRTRLANDPDVKGAGFDVIVKAGVITLRGHVHDEKSKEKATKIAKAVKGVVSVTNELKIFGQD
jgi:BON domain